MAGGIVKYRHLSRDSAHRQALLRNLLTSLIQHESIRTSYAKAKETQRMADKLITLAKRDNVTAHRKAQGILFLPKLLPKLFGELRLRYQDRPGGYTRVLRTEPKSTYDQGESAILELVDGPKDMRFAMTAAVVARDKALRRKPNALTEMNLAKVTRYRKDGEREFENMVKKMRELTVGSMKKIRKARKAIPFEDVVPTKKYVVPSKKEVVPSKKEKVTRDARPFEDVVPSKKENSGRFYLE